jgi:hypothetical protein
LLIGAAERYGHPKRVRTSHPPAHEASGAAVKTTRTSIASDLLDALAAAREHASASDALIAAEDVWMTEDEAKQVQAELAGLLVDRTHGDAYAELVSLGVYAGLVRARRDGMPDTA